MNLGYDELDGRGLSGRLWARFALPEGAGFPRTASGNPAHGFFDDFLWKAETSLYDGYFTLITGTGTIGRIASDWNPLAPTTTGLGLLQLFGTADDDEAIIAYGNAIDAPFKLTNRDLVFECRLKVGSTEADDFGLFVGLGEIGAEATTKCIDASDAIDNTYDLIGFQHLKAESTPVDGMYQVGGETKVDGAVNTGLDSIAALVAGTYIKLGFRYDARPGTVRFFVDGVEDTGARLTITTIETADADSFPDGNFMTPLAVLATPAAADETCVLDWWACAQEM